MKLQEFITIIFFTLFPSYGVAQANIELSKRFIYANVVYYAFSGNERSKTILVEIFETIGIIEFDRISKELFLSSFILKSNGQRYYTDRDSVLDIQAVSVDIRRPYCLSLFSVLRPCIATLSIEIDNSGAVSKIFSILRRF